MERKELFSNREDCYDLAKYLLKKLRGKIEYYGSIDMEVISGRYYMIPLSKCGEDFSRYDKYAVYFTFKFLNNGFLRISVYGDNKPLSEGLKLAVLSDFCATLKKRFGLPSFFYTIVADDYKSLNLNWSFTHAKEDVEAILNGTYFDDVKVDKFIEFSKDSSTQYFEKYGLPEEMDYLIKANEEDFILSKTGELFSERKDDVILEFNAKNIVSNLGYELDKEIKKGDVLIKRYLTSGGYVGYLLLAKGKNPVFYEFDRDDKNVQSIIELGKNTRLVEYMSLPGKDLGAVEAGFDKNDPSKMLYYSAVKRREKNLMPIEERRLVLPDDLKHANNSDALTLISETKCWAAEIRRNLAPQKDIILSKNN